MYSIILVTCPNGEVAEKIANALLKERLVACVNIIPKVKSLYRWEGKIERGDEALMLLKAKSKLFNEVKKKIKECHPYEVPEIICFKIDRGLKEYLSWIEEVSK